MIFNFSDLKNKKLNNINNKFNKLQYKSDNSYRLGVLPNIIINRQSIEEHKKITYKDKVEKIQDFKYRWYINDTSKQIDNVKQIIDLSYNLDYTPIKIENDFIEFNTFPNKNIYIYPNTENIQNKMSSILLKYDVFNKDEIVQQKSNVITKCKDGKMVRVNEMNLLPKYNNNPKFNFSIKSTINNINDYFIDDVNKQLLFITIIKTGSRIKIFKKYFKSYDILESKFNDIFEILEQNKRYVFTSNDIQYKNIQDNDEFLGTREYIINIKNSLQKSSQFNIDNRWLITLNSEGKFRLSDIKTDFIISIPILNRPSSRETFPFFTNRPISNYIDGKSDTEKLLRKRETIKIVENKQIYNGGSF